MSFGVMFRDLRTPLLFHASVELPGKMRLGQELVVPKKMEMKLGFHFQRLDS